ncbi:MAG: zinc ribbon domain-containing protein [Thermoplasmata archaeon]
MWGKKSALIAGLAGITAILGLSMNASAQYEYLGCMTGALCFLPIIWLVIWILIAIWVYKDAEKRGMSGILWLIIVVLLGLIGLIIYIVVRKPEQPQMPAAPPPPPPAYQQPPPPPPPAYGAPPPPPPAAPGMAPCPYCGTPNPTTATICQKCGARLR